MGTATQLYRHYDATGQLLYVGVSKSAFNRFVQHIGASEWCALVANMTVQTYSTREDALDAEALAIRTEKPRWNKHHAGDKSSSQRGYLKVSMAVLEDLDELAIRSPSARKILTALLQAMNRQNEVKLKQSSIIAMTGLSKATLGRSIALLRQKGWIDVAKDGTANVYRLNSDTFART